MPNKKLANQKSHNHNSGRLRKTFTYNDRRYEVTARTERELLEKYVALYNEVTANDGRIDTHTTVDQYFDIYFSSYRAPFLNDLRTRGCRSFYKNHVSPTIGSLKLSSVRTANLQQVINSRPGMSSGFYGNLKHLITDMFRHACADGLILKDPSVTLVYPTGEDGTRRQLTADEITMVLAGTKGNLHTCCIVMLYSGLRPGEVCALQWADIDFNKNEIHVSKSITQDKVLKSPKTKAGIRTVPMRKPLRDYLLSIRSANPFDHLLQPKSADMVQPTSLSASFNQLRKRRGWSDDISLYSFRHTFCTQLQSAGVPINIAKDLMGHSSIVVTANIYTHRDMDTLHSNIQMLDGVENAWKPCGSTSKNP